MSRDSQLRILHCIPSLGGGGAERQLCYLCEGLVRLGHEVHVATLTHGSNSARMEASGTRVHLLGSHRGRDPRNFLDILGVIRATGAQVIQTWLPRMNAWGGLATLVARRPWIASERSWGRIVIPQSLSYYPGHRPAWLTSETLHLLPTRLLAPRASAVIANSEGGATQWRRHLSGRVPVHAIENALPMHEIEAAPRVQWEHLGVPAGCEVLLYAGRFGREKRIERLADVLCAALEQRSSLIAVCCGEGPDLPAFRQTMAGRGLQDRCILLGYRSDLWSVMKASDAFISTSAYEGQPNTVLEAMACGVPMALSDIPGHRQLTGEDAAVLFDPEEPRGAARAILRIFEDRALARALAERARAKIADRTPAEMVKRYEAIYRRVALRTRLES